MTSILNSLDSKKQRKLIEDRAWHLFGASYLLSLVALIIAAVVKNELGHPFDPFSWWVWGILFGPVIISLAIAMAYRTYALWNVEPDDNQT
jgi:hypothetical protein